MQFLMYFLYLLILYDVLSGPVSEIKLFINKAGGVKSLTMHC